jgi:hypothetical protein
MLLADETRVQVLREAERANGSQSWMWCTYGGEPEYPGVMFYYSQSRSAETAEAVIGEYTGPLPGRRLQGLCNAYRSPQRFT